MKLQINHKKTHIQKINYPKEKNPKKKNFEKKIFLRFFFSKFFFSIFFFLRIFIISTTNPWHGGVYMPYRKFRLQGFEKIYVRRLFSALLNAERIWFKCDLYLRFISPMNISKICIDLRPFSKYFNEPFSRTLNHFIQQTNLRRFQNI